jgi:hypothetical protein
MTRLVTCGWETGDPNENQSGGSDTTGWSAITSSPAPKSPSAYCLRNTSNSTKVWTFAATKTDVYTRVHMWLAASATTTANVLVFYDSGGVATGNLQVHLDWSASDNLLRLYRATGTTNLLGTSSLAMTLGAWHLLEMRWQATSTSAGVVQVWLNGNLVINFSGDTTNTANVNVQSFVINGIGSGGGTAYCAIDDVAINDTAGTLNNGQIGDGGVVLLKPSGAGSNAAQTRGGTDTGANWSQTNEVPPSMTQYVFSATAATRDTYALEDIPAGSWTVNCVEVVAYGLNSDAGAGSLGLTVKSGATTNEGTAQLLGITASYLRQLYETDPNTSAAWTNANVNALEAGTTVR